MLKALVGMGMLLAFGLVVAGANAVTANGFPDNGQHPNVGAIMVPARSGVGYAEVLGDPRVADRVPHGQPLHGISRG
jgi:hypothetical protein